MVKQYTPPLVQWIGRRVFKKKLFSFLGFLGVLGRLADLRGGFFVSLWVLKIN